MDDRHSVAEVDSLERRSIFVLFRVSQRDEGHPEIRAQFPAGIVIHVRFGSGLELRRSRSRFVPLVRQVNRPDHVDRVVRPVVAPEHETGNRDQFAGVIVVVVRNDPGVHVVHACVRVQSREVLPVADRDPVVEPSVRPEVDCPLVELVVAFSEHV